MFVQRKYFVKNPSQAKVIRFDFKNKEKRHDFRPKNFVQSFRFLSKGSVPKERD